MRKVGVRLGRPESLNVSATLAGAVADLACEGDETAAGVRRPRGRRSEILGNLASLSEDPLIAKRPR